MKALSLLFFIAIFLIVDWQERRELKRSQKPIVKNPQLSLFDDEPAFADQIHPLCEN